MLSGEALSPWAEHYLKKVVAQGKATQGVEVRSSEVEGRHTETGSLNGYESRRLSPPLRSHVERGAMQAGIRTRGESACRRMYGEGTLNRCRSRG